MTVAPSIDVVVTSYRRPGPLARCLDALEEQDVEPRRVVVVARGDDRATIDVVTARANPVTLVTVAEPGVLAAQRAGVARTAADVVAFTDDDSRPRHDWIARLTEWFSRNDVGAVGGRDIQRGREPDGARVVGRLSPWGRMTGNHDVGAGPPRDVDVLKGVNLAVRSVALALPAARLLESYGTAPHYEVVITAWVARRGWRVVYDPSVAVDHEVAPRVDGARLDDQRTDTALVAAAATNRVVASTVLDRRRLVPQLFYGMAVGTRETPGLARTAVAAWRGEDEIRGRLRPSLAGQLRGAWRVLTWSGPPVVTYADTRAMP